MPFDVEGARKAGYTDAEIADHLGQQSRFDTAAARKGGYSDAEIIQHLRAPVESFKAPPTERQELLASAPMRLAKGGKDPIDGAAQLLQRMLPDGVVNAVNKAADFVGGEGTFLGDVVGIKGATKERLNADIRDSNAEYEEARRATGQEGFDAARLTGNILSPVSLTAGRFVPGLKAGAPLKQLAGRGAIGGAAGAAVQPTMGADEDFAAEKLKQVALGAAGGAVLGPTLTRLGESGARLVERWRNSRGAVNVTPERLRELVTQQLRQDGIEAADIPEHVFRELTNDVRGALAKGKDLDAVAALRAKDFAALQIPATQGQLTRNPAQWAREHNLMGVEGVGEPLQEVAQAQSAGITRRFQHGARAAAEKFTAGQQLGDELRAADETAQRGVRAAYGAFRDATGREVDVPLQGLAQDYARTVETFGDAIPGAVRRQFEGLGLMGGTQRRTLNIEQAEQLIKAINANYDPANRVSARALDDLRRGVERAVTETADAGGTEAAQLAAAARQAAAQRFQTIRDTPALRAAIDGMEPDKFVDRFVLRGNVNEIQRMQALLGPEGRDQVRAQTIAYLQQKAFGANAAGDGKAAQAAFNTELQRIGRPKLEALLGPGGAEEMLQIGRVLAYIKQVPEGATPNVSGTGQMLTSLMGRMRGVQGLPFVNDYLVQPVARFGERREVQQALSGPPQTPTQLDPKTVELLSSLFTPAPVALGSAAARPTPVR